MRVRDVIHVTHRYVCGETEEGVLGARFTTVPLLHPYFRLPSLASHLSLSLSLTQLLLFACILLRDYRDVIFENKNHFDLESP